MRILIREGVNPKVSGHFFKAVVQEVLLFGEETWVLTYIMERALNIFQKRVTQRLTGRQSRRRGDRIWDHPPLTAAMAEAGFEEIRTYVTRRQKMVAQYNAT